MQTVGLRLRRFLSGHRGLKLGILSTFNWWSQTFGMSPLVWPRLPGELFHYARSLVRYRALRAGHEGPLHAFPILFQRSALGFDAHYTYQGAWATRRVLALDGLAEHVDISSDIRFVTQLSCAVRVRYVEFRPTQLDLPGLTVQRGSLEALPFEDRAVRSLSCLHVIEHVGLGRYGDPLDADGPTKAIRELTRVLAPGGQLLLSVPIGEPRVLFNAHRIFHPEWVPAECPGLQLVEFSAVTTSGEFRLEQQPEALTEEEYACGLYLLRRPEADRTRRAGR